MLNTLPNIFQINNWDNKTLLLFNLAIHFAVWGIVLCDFIGLEIPLLRKIILFFYLTFYPGTLILKILKLHNKDNTENLLYSLGLSIWFLYVIGFVMNLLFPSMGISRPISFLPLFISITLSIFLLANISVLIDNKFKMNSCIDLTHTSLVVLFSFLFIPIFTLAGIFTVNYYQNNFILLISIIFISLIPIIVIYCKFIFSKLFPYIIFLSAISLLFHISLVTFYLTGWDVHYEYRVQQLVEISQYWDMTLSHNFNSVLSVSILPTIYSLMLDIDAMIVFKVLYPFIFSFVPIGLYKIFKRNTNENISFLSVFYFIFAFTFFGELVSLAKQEVAEVFLMLTLMVLLNKDLNPVKAKILYFIFCSGIIVSHYGTFYLFTGVSFIAFIIYYLIREKNKNFTITMIAFLLIAGISWFMYAANSSSFNSLINIGIHVIDALYNDFLDPGSNQPLNLLIRDEKSILYLFNKILYYISLVLIFIGLSGVVVSSRHHFDRKINSVFLAYSLACFCILLAVIFLPRATSMNINRIFHLLSFVLSPYFVIGGISILKVLNKHCSVYSAQKIIAVFLCLFLLFNSGWIYEIMKDNPKSISLSPSIDGLAYNEGEAASAKWISDFTDIDSTIYGDAWAIKILADWVHLENNNIFINDNQISLSQMKLEPISYIYLRSWNIEKKELVFHSIYYTVPIIVYRRLDELSGLASTIIGNNKIYNNGRSEIISLF